MNLTELAKANGIEIVAKDYTIPEVVQETYKLTYRLKESTNEELKTLAEAHVNELRTDVTNTDKLAEGLEILLALEKLGESAILDEALVKKAKPRGVIDVDRSKAMKKAWKKNGGKMKKALKKFRKSAKGKAFSRALGKFNSKMNDSSEMTLEESILLFKAGNSALTHLTVELEHNPDFKEAFDEAAAILSQDLGLLLESIISSQIPEQPLLESFQDFHEILSSEDEEGDDE